MARRRVVLVVTAITTAAVTAFGLPSTSGAAATRTVGLWQMNEPRGATVAVDSSGNGLNGRIGSLVTTGFTYAGATGYRFGYTKPNTPPAQPERLVTVPHSTRLDPGTGDYAVTVRFRTTNSFGNLIQKGQSGVTGGYFKWEVPKGIVKCLYRDGSGRQVGVGSGRALNDGAWHTVRCERTGGTVTMTVDGAVSARKTGTLGSVANKWPLSIAGKVHCDQIKVTCDYFPGDVEYVRIEAG